MKQREIFINKIPRKVCLGDHISGRGHAITWKEGRNVIGHYLKGFLTNDPEKTIMRLVPVVQYDTDELKYAYEYYKEGTNVPLDEVGERFLDEYKKESKGAQYSVFYAIQSNGQAGDILHRNGLRVHAFEVFGLEIINEAGEIIQPVNFGLAFIERQPEDPYRLTVDVIDGIAPYFYSTGSLPLNDPAAWQAEPELVYLDPENKYVYVRDSAGTINRRSIKPTDWQPVTL